MSDSSSQGIPGSSETYIPVKGTAADNLRCASVSATAAGLDPQHGRTVALVVLGWSGFAAAAEHSMRQDDHGKAVLYMTPEEALAVARMLIRAAGDTQARAEMKWCRHLDSARV